MKRTELSLFNEITILLAYIPFIVAIQIFPLLTHIYDFHLASKPLPGITHFALNKSPALLWLILMIPLLNIISKCAFKKPGLKPEHLLGVCAVLIPMWCMAFYLFALLLPFLNTIGR